MVEEARLQDSGSGLMPATDGWFVVNVRDAAWETGPFGSGCFFESEAAPFTQLGINVRVIERGRSRWLYHAESGQEDFLVLVGECVLLVEERERSLRAWDLVHCPPGTAHAFVPAGDTPCVILMVGARGPRWPARGIAYPRSDLARRHGVGVEKETSSPAEAQAALSLGDWRLARPESWSVLPWAQPPAPEPRPRTR